MLLRCRLEMQAVVDSDLEMCGVDKFASVTKIVTVGRFGRCCVGSGVTKWFAKK